MRRCLPSEETIHFHHILCTHLMKLTRSVSSFLLRIQQRVFIRWRCRHDERIGRGTHRLRLRRHGRLPGSGIPLKITKGLICVFLQATIENEIKSKYKNLACMSATSTCLAIYTYNIYYIYTHIKNK